jgi:hypothetical protein
MVRSIIADSEHMQQIFQHKSYLHATPLMHTVHILGSKWVCGGTNSMLPYYMQSIFIFRPCVHFLVHVLCACRFCFAAAEATFRHAESAVLQRAEQLQQVAKATLRKCQQVQYTPSKQPCISIIYRCVPRINDHV